MTLGQCNACNYGLALDVVQVSINLNFRFLCQYNLVEMDADVCICPLTAGS